MTMDTLGANFDGEYDLFTKDSKGDDRLAVRFFLKAARDDVKSTEEGRMIFRDVEYVQIMVPGDRDNIIIRPAGEGDKRRFRKQYDEWKRDEKSEQVIGTPLDIWGRLTLSQVEEFRYVGVRTVEQLAELRDDAMLRMPGAIELKKKAAAFMQAQKDEAPMRHLQAELERRDAESAATNERVAELTAQVERQAQLIAQAEARAARAK
jgi:hypothetical protein